MNIIASLLLLIIPRLEFRDVPAHPYQHPRLVAYHNERLMYADVDHRGVIVRYREIPKK